jgi:chromate reductase, NAD(P)H dehydrogenase (quinone)
MHVLGISGSLRRDSYNTALLHRAGELIEAGGAEFTVYDGLGELPIYDQDLDGDDPPEAVARIRAAVRQADAVFFATPEYNTSIPGGLKNAVDWLSRPSLAESALRRKPAAVVGASTGAFGAVWAQAELRKVLSATGARVIDGDVAVGYATDRFDARGRLDDEELEQELHEVTDTLVAEARTAHAPPLAT